MKLNKFKKQANEKGFTLIELMIVIAIIGILAAVAIPNFIAYRDKSYCSAAEKDANSIAATIADYFAIPSRTSLCVPLNLGIIDQGFKPNSNQLYCTAGGGITVVDSPNFSALSGKNNAIVRGDIDELKIEVLDGSKRCPTDYINAQSGAGWAWDAGNNRGKFTKEMK